MNSFDKKILVFDKFLGYNVGGAQKSLHQLLENLNCGISLFGCDVKKSFNAQKYKNDKWQVERFFIRECPRLPYFEYWLNRRIIKKQIKNRPEKNLISQGLWGAMAIRFFEGKAIYFIRDEYQLNKIGVYQTGYKKILKYLYLLIQLPFILIMFHDSKMVIKKAKLVVANSQFIKNKIKEKFGIEAVLIYPLVDVKYLQSQKDFLIKEKEYVTSIGSELIKGKIIVEKIAEKMPEQKFMIVGREYDLPKQVDNILYQPWSNNVLDIYKKTKILLIPSLCEEAFGRAALEAISLGIPAIGSNRGGIPEILGSNGVISNIWQIDVWIEKIKDVILNQDKYLKKDLKEFDYNLQIDNFKKSLNKCFNLSL